MKQNVKRTIKSRYLFSSFTIAALALAWGISFGDDDDSYGFLKRQPGVAPVTNNLYAEECGSCHFAYPPGLLPAQSWHKIMNQLDDHFGDNAELGGDTKQQLLSYLTNNSADKVNNRRSRKIMRTLSMESAPMRITELPYFKHEHDEIPARVIKTNDKIASLSHCDTCHQNAKAGSFNESQINIPGIGRWDD